MLPKGADTIILAALLSRVWRGFRMVLEEFPHITKWSNLSLHFWAQIWPKWSLGISKKSCNQIFEFLPGSQKYLPKWLLAQNGHFRPKQILQAQFWDLWAKIWKSDNTTFFLICPKTTLAKFNQFGQKIRFPTQITLFCVY